MNDIKIKCNDCNFIGLEEDLEILASNKEYFRGCPNCKTDKFLIDNITTTKKYIYERFN